MDTALPENFDEYNLSTLSCIIFHVGWKFLNNTAITESIADSYSEQSTARKAVSASPSYFSHVWTGKRLVKFATALLVSSYGSSSQVVCRATFNSTL